MNGPTCPECKKGFESFNALPNLHDDQYQCPYCNAVNGCGEWD